MQAFQRLVAIALTSVAFLASASGESNDAPANILVSYTAASSLSDRQLRGATMQIGIQAVVPKLEKKASLSGRRSISSDGAVSYDALSLSGDAEVRKHVIARYLAAEVNPDHQHQMLALTPENYKFRFREVRALNGMKVFVFHVKPLHKQEGAFEGDLWLDAATSLPVRESGRVLQHSMFLRRITFVRNFRILDHTSIPEQITVSVDTRIVGRAEMTVDFHDVTLLGVPAEADNRNISRVPAVQ